MIETIRPATSPDARVALFDFDGSLSLIRTGWMQVMIPMMIEILGELKTGETEDLAFVDRGRRPRRGCERDDDRERQRDAEDRSDHTGRRDRGRWRDGRFRATSLSRG